MPIYEYRCQACGVELEKLQKISDPPLVECPECGKESLVKLVSASSFRLKGGGWYESDFKTGNRKNGLAEATVAASDNNADAGAGAGAAKESATSAKKEDAAKPAKGSAGSQSSGSGSQSTAV